MSGATGSEPLRLYTLYAPPEHRDGTVHATKADADAADEHFERCDERVAVDLRIARRHQRENRTWPTDTRSRNPMTAWWIGLAVIIAAVAYTAYRFACMVCARPASWSS